MYIYIYIYISFHVRNSIIFGRFVAKLGPGSVAIVFGMACSSNLVGSNLNVIDYNAYSWPFWFQKSEPKQQTCKIRSNAQVL